MSLCLSPDGRVVGGQEDDAPEGAGDEDEQGGVRADEGHEGGDVGEEVSTPLLSQQTMGSKIRSLE